MPPALLRVSFAGADAEFDCGRDETLLRAALRAGFAVPYECASGSCGSCKARLVEGAVESRWTGGSGLSERDRKRGDRILCCQSVPTTPCVVRWSAERGNTEPPPGDVTGEVRAIDDLCRGVRRLDLKLDREVRALPGQFMLFDFGAPIGLRAYSMTGASERMAALEFLVKSKAGGAASEFLFERLRIGDRLKLDGPYGRAYLRASSSRPVVAVAGGSGLAPMLAIVRAALRSSADRDVRLFFGVNRRDEMFFEPELRELAADFARFKLTIVLREAARDAATGAFRIGLVGDHMLAECPDLADCDLYCAGPPAMVDRLISQTIGENRISADRVFFDRF